jgi:hypothetical protein
VLEPAPLAGSVDHDLLGRYGADGRGEVAQQHPPEEEAVEAVGAGQACGACPLALAQQPERAVAVERSGTAPCHPHAAVDRQRTGGRTASL